MVEVPADTSKSYILCIGTNSGKITICDSSGKTVGEYESSRTFSSLVFSSEELVRGETYTVYEDGKEIGSAEITDTVTYINTSESSSFGDRLPGNTPGQDKGMEDFGDDSIGV